MVRDPADVLFGVASALGATWRRSRRKLPRSTRAKFVELLHDIKGHISPKPECNANENIRDARTDIRDLTEFLRRIATRGFAETATGVANRCTASGTIAARMRWCDMRDDDGSEESACENSGGLPDTVSVGTQTLADVCDMSSVTTQMQANDSEVQTEMSMANFAVICEHEAVLGMVQETACRTLLQEIASFESSIPPSCFEYVFAGAEDVHIGEDFPLQEFVGGDILGVHCGVFSEKVLFQFWAKQTSHIFNQDFDQNNQKTRF